MSKLHNLVGKTFNRLTVVSLAYRKNTKVHWECLCKCGNTVFVTSGALHQSHTRSCGCLIIDTITKHGKSIVREHKIWRGIKGRCLNEHDRDYISYGGRGITICDRWLEYDNFISDMGPAPSLDHSIERINNNEGYSPNNCKWGTRIEQANNRRSSVIVTHNGDTKTLGQWCRELNLPYQRVHRRINVYNWSVERAFK